MTQSFIFQISPTLRPSIYLVIAFFSVTAFSEIELVPTGKTVELLSSKAVVKLIDSNIDPNTETKNSIKLCDLTDDQLIKEKARKNALNLCKQIHKNLKEVQFVNIQKYENKTILDEDEKVYRTNVLATEKTGEGFILIDKTSPLELFPYKIPISEKIKMGGCIASLAFFTGGGLSTFLVALGPEGSSNLQTVFIFGSLTAVMVAASLTFSGIAYLYQTFTSNDLSIDEEMALPSAQLIETFVMPILASSILCE